MENKKYLYLLAICLSFSASGCAVPYFTSLRGPIRGIRLIDAETGADIPEATVSLTSQKSERYLGPPPASLTCPNLVEQRSAAYRGVLKRNADLSYRVPSGLGMGTKGYFTGRPEDANEYPRGIVLVTAQGYRPAMLRYTVGQIMPGWSLAEMVDPVGSSLSDSGLPGIASDSYQGDRCELGEDGILRFHLRPIKNEATSPVSPMLSATEARN
jgi:hypothetical protein